MAIAPKELLFLMSGQRTPCVHMFEHSMRAIVCLDKVHRFVDRVTLDTWALSEKPAANATEEKAMAYYQGDLDAPLEPVQVEPAAP